MTFVDELKAARQRLALTQVEMAALLDVPARVYWDMEQGVEHYAITREGARARISAAGRAAGAELAELCRSTARQIQRNLAALVTLGEIVKISDGGGRGRPARYRLKGDIDEGV